MASYAHDLGDCRARDVVLRRSQSAAADHRVAALERLTQGRNDAPMVVSDLGLVERINSSLGQLFTNPGRVRIDDLTEQQFGANRHHFTTHAWSAPAVQKERASSLRAAAKTSASRLFSAR